MGAKAPIKINRCLMVFTQWSYKDALIQTYTLPYVDLMRKVIPMDKKIIVVTAEQSRIALNREEKEAINREWASRNMELHTLEYKRYGIRKMLSFFGQMLGLYRVIIAQRVDLLHAFCTPAGGFAWMLSVLSARKLVIDSFEPHAEAMVENGTWAKTGWAYRLLFWLEKRQAIRARYIISATAGMKDYALKTYGVDITPKMFVKGACVDTNQFYPMPKDPTLLQELGLTPDHIVCVYAGKLGGIYYDEEVFSFLHSAHSYWGERFRFLILTNEKRELLDARLDKALVPHHILINRFVPHQEVPRYLSVGDFGINPVKPVPSKRYCTPIKDGEYWAMGLPTLIGPGISDDSEIIEATQTGVVVDIASEHDHEAALKKMDNLLSGDRTVLRQRIVSNAVKYRSFSIPAAIYPQIYA